MKIKLFKDFISEGFGPQGYFPPMGADTPREKNKDTEEIYKTGVAVKVTTELKKLIDKINPEFEKAHSIVVPFVNYYPSTQSGNLILGFFFTKGPGYNHDADNKLASELYYKYKDKLKAVLELSKTEIWNDYHKGINVNYKGKKYQTGIAYSIVTPQSKFNDTTATKLENILNK